MIVLLFSIWLRRHGKRSDAKFNKYTTDGLIDLNETLNEEGKGILALTVEKFELERVLKEISFDAKILDQARRFGTGVSSRPAIRYVVALEDEKTEHSNWC